jgi:hypothetical protein
MSVQVFDAALALLTPGAALAANGSGTGVLLYPRHNPVCDWVLYLSGVVATGTYTFNLQVSDLIGGTYTTIASFTWPPAVPGGRVHIPINGQMAAFLDSDSRFMRVNYAIGGTTPGAVVGSFLAKAATNAGLGIKQGDIVSVG